MKEKTRTYLIHSAVALSIAVTAFCLVFFLRKLYTFTGYCDAFFISSIITLCCSGFAFVHRSGTFDVLHYGMSRLLAQWTHKDEKKYANAGDYHEVMKEKRQSNPFPYLPYLILGSVLLVIAIVFLILSANNIG